MLTPASARVVSEFRMTVRDGAQFYRLSLWFQQVEINCCDQKSSDSNIFIDTVFPHKCIYMFTNP